MQGNPSARRSAVGSGLVTGLSVVAVSASAAAAGAILSRKYGHGVKTDGFFAAYSVYLALVLVATALRVVVLPRCGHWTTLERPAECIAALKEFYAGRA